MIRPHACPPQAEALAAPCFPGSPSHRPPALLTHPPQAEALAASLRDSSSVGQYSFGGWAWGSNTATAAADAGETPALHPSTSKAE